ncbi:MAG TPA: PBP1A family penicillin-binding protein [Candidatus Paceibacterota bacterium]|nr:PBP1A family penicillin-binding protein [Candidatus Paceibacterota bacterium]
MQAMLRSFGRFTKRHLKSARRHWRAIMVWGFGGLFLFSGLFLLWAATLQIPDLQSLANRKVEQSLKMYDRTGTVLLYDLHNNQQRTIVPVAEISPNISHAVIAIEDPGFYQHGGIDPKAILRAVISQLTGGLLLTRSGGSTITQQVVKGSILTNDQTISRKFKEWILAIKMEQVFSKDQILELYLNQVPFGGSVYGVEEASQTFFGKHASDLTLPESAYLAAVLPAPTYYSPFGNHKAALDARKNLVLEKMHEHGYITESEMTEAESAQVTFVTPPDSSIQAPHFVFYVQQYLEDKYGSDALESGGWKITTTLDADLQVKAEEIVKRNALLNTDKFNASNAALIALDPQNGQILSMVGSRNYFDTQIDGAYNAAVTAPGRQPGSAFKPFAYAEAFEKGYTPDTVLFDVRTQFSTSCAESDMSNVYPCYSPVNYDDEFRGPMTLRDALAQSINVPAVKVLYLAGLNDTLELAKSMGISTLTDSNRYGLTLVLGGGEVTLLDMSSAYGVFAQDGVKYQPVSVLKIEDGQGNVIEDNSEPAGTQIVPKPVAEEINDILSDPVARAPLGENSLVSFPGRDVAVKTGTTNDYKDAWTIGYTPNLVVGVWAGNNDNTSMVKKVSGFIVGPMWHEVMQYELARIPNQSFSRSDQGGGYLKPVLRGIWQGDVSTFQNGIEYVNQSVHEILNWVDKDNPNGPIPADPTQDSQYSRWEYPVRIWAQQNGYVDGVQVPVGNAPSQTPPQTTPTATTTGF